MVKKNYLKKIINKNNKKVIEKKIIIKKINEKNN